MQVVGQFYFWMLDGNCPIINVKKLQPKDSAKFEPHYLQTISSPPGCLYTLVLNEDFEQLHAWLRLLRFLQRHRWNFDEGGCWVVEVQVYLLASIKNSSIVRSGSLLGCRVRPQPNCFSPFSWSNLDQIPFHSWSNSNTSEGIRWINKPITFSHSLEIDLRAGQPPATFR